MGGCESATASSSSLRVCLNGHRIYYSGQFICEMCKKLTEYCCRSLRADVCFKCFLKWEKQQIHNCCVCQEKIQDRKQSRLLTCCHSTAANIHMCCLTCAVKTCDCGTTMSDIYCLPHCHKQLTCEFCKQRTCKLFSASIQATVGCVLNSKIERKICMRCIPRAKLKIGDHTQLQLHSYCKSQKCKQEICPDQVLNCEFCKQASGHTKQRKQYLYLSSDCISCDNENLREVPACCQCIDSRSLETSLSLSKLQLPSTIVYLIDSYHVVTELPLKNKLKCPLCAEKICVKHYDSHIQTKHIVDYTS